MKELTDRQAEIGMIKSRLKTLGENLINLSKISLETPNLEVEMECILGATIASLQIQLSNLNSK